MGELSCPLPHPRIMPPIRKIIKIGNSRAVIIPPDWLRHQERKKRRPITNLLMEVDGSIILSVGEEEDGRTGTAVRQKTSNLKRAAH